MNALGRAHTDTGHERRRDGVTIVVGGEQRNCAAIKQVGSLFARSAALSLQLAGAVARPPPPPAREARDKSTRTRLDFLMSLGVAFEAKLDEWNDGPNQNQPLEGISRRLAGK